MTIIKDSILRDSILKNSIVSASTLRQPSGTTSPYLDGVDGYNAVWEFDVRLANDTSNKITSPADGSAQSAYDFTLGSNATISNGGTSSGQIDFNGTNGATQIATNTTFTNSLHKTTGGSDWTAVMYALVATGGGTCGIFSTQDSTVNIGLRMQINDTPNIGRLSQRGSVNSISSSADVLTRGSAQMIIISHSHSSNLTRFWLGNSGTAQEISHTFSTTTANASATFSLFTLFGGGSIPFSVNSKAYMASMSNNFIDDTVAAAIIANVTAR